MLYLAKISRQDETGEISLHLLARQKSEYYWILSSGNSPVLNVPDNTPYGHGALVLVSVSRDRTIESIRDATDWVLTLVSQYLNTGVTPEFLRQEAERAEECRKELTLKTQDIARRAIELETRRDQIQELEKKLELERQQLEAMRAKAEPNAASVTETEESGEPHANTHANTSETEGDNYPADVV